MSQTQNETKNAKAAIVALADSLALSRVLKFVPWSQSRNKAEKNPSLNYRVTLQRSGVDLFEFDYTMGSAHAPSYKQSPRVIDAACVRAECETGKRNTWSDGLGRPVAGRESVPGPTLTDVLAALAVDSDVLNYSKYEEWARDLGYDPDSRKGEAIYRQCLEHALALRNAIGSDKLDTLAAWAREL